jgi:sulfur-carrier protein
VVNGPDRGCSIKRDTLSSIKRYKEDINVIKVLFFAQVKEQLGTENVQIKHNEDMNIQQLKLELAQHKPDWNAVFSGSSLLAAVNQTIVDDSTIIYDGDEVAFFPPVTGG